MHIIGILLAGGHSRRFGSNKLLHPMADEQPVALVAARHLLAALPQSIAIVRDDTPLGTLLKGTGMQVIECTTAQQGMGDSLAAAVRFAAAQGEVDGFVIALADMPYIQPQTITAVADALAGGAGIALPVHAGQRGHPVGFAARFSDALQALAGDEGARAIVQANRSMVLEIAVEDAGVLRDIDYPTDLQADPAAD